MLFVISFVFINDKVFAASKYSISHLDLDQTHSYAYCINNNSAVCEYLILLILREGTSRHFTGLAKWV